MIGNVNDCFGVKTMIGLACESIRRLKQEPKKPDALAGYNWTYFNLFMKCQQSNNAM